MKKLLALLVSCLITGKLFAQCGITVTYNNTYPSFCGGNDGSIIANVSGGFPPFTYAWNNSATTAVASGLSVGEYNVVITDNNGCHFYDTLELVGLVNHPLTASTNSPVCENSQLWLTTNTGMANYKWFNGDTSQLAGQSPFSDGSTYSVYINAGSNNNGETLTVVVTDMSGCRDTSSVITIVNPLPLATAICSTQVCDGSGLTIYGGPNGMTSYVWTGPGALTVISQNVIFGSANAGNSGLYTLSVTDLNGCSNWDTASVFVNPLPVATVSANTPCIGQSLNFTGGPSGMVTYAWTGPYTLPNVQNPTIIFASASDAGIYTLTVMDSYGCIDTAMVNVIVNPSPIALPSSNSPVCVGSNLIFSSGTSGLASYFWGGGILQISSTQENPIFTNADSILGGHYVLQVTDVNGCTDTAGVNVTVVNDCVYPGDANYDMVADNMDVLSIGLAYGDTGPVRNNATTAWQGQAAVDWVSQFANGVNHKQADCDGNGIVEAIDTTAIQLNYGAVHQKTSTVNSSSGPVLAVHFPSGNFPAGTNILAPVTLGDGTLPASNVYGVAFTITYSGNVLHNDQVNISFNNNWIGSNILTLYHNNPLDNNVDVAISRIDHTSISGDGEICSLEGVTIGNVAGKDESFGMEYFTISNVRLIDNLGTDIPFDIQNDSVMVTPNGIKDQKTSIASIIMFPNPANDVLNIVSDIAVRKIEIRDVSGKIVKVEIPLKGNKIKLDISLLDAAVYVVSCEDEKGNINYIKTIAS